MDEFENGNGGSSDDKNGQGKGGGTGPEGNGGGSGFGGQSRKGNGNDSSQGKGGNIVLVGNEGENGRGRGGRQGSVGPGGPIGGLGGIGGVVGTGGIGGSGSDANCAWNGPGICGNGENDTGRNKNATLSFNKQKKKVTRKPIAKKLSEQKPKKVRQDRTWDCAAVVKTWIKLHYENNILQSSQRLVLSQLCVRSCG